MDEKPIAKSPLDIRNMARDAMSRSLENDVNNVVFFRVEADSEGGVVQTTITLVESER